ncbi:MAG: nucleoside triphosphate pyrophosphohydrolase [Bacilli bacterium]|nr:nucleoside triphosphate pyrophosphohydrolase [Bacilli bacterium]
MHKLIRDNVPQIMKEANQICDYASIENIELYIFALKEKLVEEVNEFLQKSSLTELVDVQTVINALVKASVGEEKFKEEYDKRLEVAGGFDKKYIMFYNPQVEQETPEEEVNTNNN